MFHNIHRVFANINLIIYTIEYLWFFLNHINYNYFCSFLDLFAISLNLIIIDELPISIDQIFSTKFYFFFKIFFIDYIFSILQIVFLFIIFCFSYQDFYFISRLYKSILICDQYICFYLLWIYFHKLIYVFAKLISNYKSCFNNIRIAIITQFCSSYSSRQTPS